MSEYRLLTAAPAAQAHVLVGALRTEGIEARLERDGLGAVYGLTFGAHATRVLVRSDDYEAALSLLRASE